VDDLEADLRRMLERVRLQHRAARNAGNRAKRSQDPLAAAHAFARADAFGEVGRLLGRVLRERCDSPSG
jgi:hypothetical protein